MNTMPISRVIQLVFFLGCGYIYSISDCLTVSADYQQNTAEFICTISPYLGSQTWSVDSTVVSDCGLTFCSKNASNPDRFSFTDYRSNGTFIFKISPFNENDDESIIKCDNGTFSQELIFAAPVDADDEGGDNKLLIIAYVVCPVFVLLFVLIIFYFYSKPKINVLEGVGNTIYLEFTDIACFRRKYDFNILCKLVRDLRQNDERNINIKETSYKFENVFDSSYYNVSITAWRPFCFPPSTVKKIVRTHSAIPVIYYKEQSAEECILKWEVGEFPGSDKLEYMLEYRSVNGDDWIKQGIILDKRYTLLQSLQPKTSYTVRVYAIYQLKLLEPPGVTSFKTIEIKPEDTIRDSTEKQNKDTLSALPELELTITLKDNESAMSNIEWFIVKSDGLLHSGLKYMLEYSLEDTNDWIKQGIILEERKTQMKLPYPSASYQIRVYAIYQSVVLGKYQITTRPKKMD